LQRKAKKTQQCRKKSHPDWLLAVHDCDFDGGAEAMPQIRLFF
jgi:hypothetical protein